MALAHADGDGHRLVEEVAAGHGHEQVEHAVAAQHRLGAQPFARDVEGDVAAAHEDDAAMGDDHARGEVDVVANEGDLALPNDTVRLQGAPNGAAGAAHGGDIARRLVVLDFTLQHA